MLQVNARFISGLDILKILVLFEVVVKADVLGSCQHRQPSLPDACERNSAKKVYVVGGIGVGKSTFCNVLTSQSPSRGVFETGAGANAVTKCTYDQGCFSLVDADGVNIVMVDTPGLNDVDDNDITNLMGMEKYHNENIKTEDIGTSAFILLIDGRGRITNAMVTMMEDFTRSFGPSFWKHVVIVFVRMPFTKQNIRRRLVVDFNKKKKDKIPVYGKKLLAHKKKWSNEITKIAKGLVTEFFTMSDGSVDLSDIPDLFDRVLYIDVIHYIKKEQHEDMVEICSGREGDPVCTGFDFLAHDKYIKENPQLPLQFRLEITKLSSLLNDLSAEPFNELMLSAKDRLLDVTKNNCAKTKFKHWSTYSLTCDWNVCQCSHGLGLKEHECPEHNFKACVTCEDDYQLVNARIYNFHHPILGPLTIDREIGDCEYKTCVCPGGTARLGASCKSIGDTECEKCSIGHELLTNGECVYKQCSCFGGTGKKGSACGDHGASDCAICDSSYELMPNGTCKYKKCVCPGGIAKSGANCSWNGDLDCESCHSGFQFTEKKQFFLKNHNECVYKKCVCPGGIAKSGASCLSNGDLDCVSCYEGYQLIMKMKMTNNRLKLMHGECVCDSDHELINGVCKYKKCVCPGGIVKSGAGCSSNGDLDCKSCNSGYKLTENENHDECVYKQCSCSNGTGKSGAACKTHGASDCASCEKSDQGWPPYDSDYELINGKCVYKQCKCTESRFVFWEYDTGRGDRGSDCYAHDGHSCASCGGDGSGCAPGQNET